MNSGVRDLVTRRAGGRCEYCRLCQEDSFYSFHVEHIIPRQHGGCDEPENLALSCRRCNLYKGPNLTSFDPDKGDIVPLFHPRRDVWNEHFRMEAARTIGLTPTGRATVQLFRMNADPRRKLRETVSDQPSRKGEERGPR